jgi:hypothetical protein
MCQVLLLGKGIIVKSVSASCFGTSLLTEAGELMVLRNYGVQTVIMALASVYILV